MVVYTELDNYLSFLKLEKKVINDGHIEAKKLYNKLEKKYSKKKYIDLYNDWYIKNLLHLAYDLKKPRAIIELKRREKIEQGKRLFLEIKNQWGEAHAKEMVKKSCGKKMLDMILNESVYRFQRVRL